MAILLHVDEHCEGRFWVITISTIDAVTQAHRWSEDRPMAQDCAALLLDVSLHRVRVGAVRRTPGPDWRS